MPASRARIASTQNQAIAHKAPKSVISNQGMRRFAEKHLRLEEGQSCIPRIMKNSMAAITAEAGTVMIQAAAMRRSKERFTSSWR